MGEIPHLLHFLYGWFNNKISVEKISLFLRKLICFCLRTDIGSVKWFFSGNEVFQKFLEDIYKRSNENGRDNGSLADTAESSKQYERGNNSQNC